MRQISVVIGPLAAASANTIALTQTPNAGSLILNGASATNGVATLDMARRVLITTAANESANTFTIFGTNWSGIPISETIVGPNVSTAQSILDYLTVTKITVSSNASGAITVGTSGVAASPWIRMDDYALPQVGVQCNVIGTVNYTVQQTMDFPGSTEGPLSPLPYASVVWLPSADSNVVAATASQASAFPYAPIFVRVMLNSGTGSVTMRTVQYGAVPY